MAKKDTSSTDFSGSVLPKERRRQLRSLVGDTIEWESLTIDLAQQYLADPRELEGLLNEPGFRTFLKKRSGKSRRRFEELFDLLMRGINRGIKPDRIGEIAEILTRESYIKIERSFYMVPIDEEGCRLFDQGCVFVGWNSPKLLPQYLAFCRSPEFGFLRKEYEECRDCLKAIFEEMIQVILLEKKSSDAEELAALFIREGLPEILETARKAGETEEFVKKLVKGFLSREDPDTLLKAIQVFGRRYAKQPALGYKRLNDAWSHLLRMSSAEGKELGEFITLYGKAKDKLQQFIWDTTFSLEPPLTGKAVSLFISGAFSAVVSRFRANPEVLILLIRNLMAALLEMKIENLDVTVFPIVMKLLLKLNIERRFLQRRGKFFTWLKEQSSSIRLELEVIRLILFEYIFIVTDIVPQTTPQRMTKFCDKTHLAFCRSVDDVFGDTFAMRERSIDDVFNPLLKTLRDELWEAPKEKFSGQAFLLEEIRSVAEDRDLEDRVLSALEELDADHLEEYHESVIDIFRRVPEHLEEAVRPDYWYRIDLSRALTHVRGAVAPLVGLVPILPDSKGNAATDGRVVYLPAAVNYFTDPVDPLENNRNVSVYVALGLHEAGHIIGGTFRFDLSLYMMRLENPELFHLIMNAFEDYRIENVLRRIKAHPQVDQLITMFNRYLSLEITGNEKNPLVLFLLHTVDTAAGDSKALLDDDQYRVSRELIISSGLPAGRFGSMKRFFQYTVERLTHMDLCNPLAAAALAEECYQVILSWPKETTGKLTDRLFGEKRPAPKAGEGAEEPLNQEELRELYRQYNENPEEFLGERNLETLKELLPRGKRPGENGGDGKDGDGKNGGEKGDEGREDSPGLIANSQMVEQLEVPRGREDYLTQGTMDFSTRTKADDLIAQRQIEKGDSAIRRKPLPQAPRPKVSRIYSIDPKTKSRTRLSEVKEYSVKNINRSFMTYFRKWAYISHRVEQYLSAMMPRTEELHDLSEVEGELNMSELIEALSGENPVGQFNFLDIYHETRNTLEAVIGIDISGSTIMDSGEGNTILDVEKTFAMILGSALEHLTDRVSLYGFNSGTSTNVYRAESVHAVSSFQSSDSNRDGDFIRYISRKLEQSDQDTRYFFLISDGQPSAVNYEGKEALDDTVIAMRETVKSGIKLIYLNVDIQKAEYFTLFQKEATYAEHFSSPEQLLLKIPHLVEAVMKSML